MSIGIPSAKLTRTRMALASLLLVAIAAPVAAPTASAADQRAAIVVVTHPPVIPTLVQGTGIGAVRSFYSPMNVRGGRAGLYFMTGTLTTTALTPDGKQEVRMSNLVFVFGKPFNQLVVGGVAFYPADGSTLAVGDTAVRPIIGGSGRYARAHGWVVSTNNGAAGWTHEFHLLLS